tara:strand:+ start:30 stop:830 length:801 start_codon:yes stop_codon:yes gene_type:complete
MIIGENFFLTEFGKTGTTFLREYFKQYKNVKLTIHHDFIGEENKFLLKKKYRVTTIRNPFSWYVSLWKWSCHLKKKSPLYSDLTSRRIKIRRLKIKLKTFDYFFIQLFKDIAYWKRLFEDPNSKSNFNLWLEKFLSDESKLEIGSDYSFTASNKLGYMTFQFLIRNCLKGDLNSLYNDKNKGLEPIEILFNKQFTNYVLKTENLINDLKILLEKINFDALNFDKLQNYQPKDKSLEYLKYFNEDNKELIMKKEQIIFKKFYPEIRI